MSKILIVDDVFFNRMLLTELVRDIGHQTMEAENGQEAINIIVAEDIDVIFMDIEMPVMNGLETTRYIRTKLPPPKRNIPIVIITAYDPASFMKSHSDVDYNELLTKPYDADKLLSILNKFC